MGIVTGAKFRGKRGFWLKVALPRRKLGIRERTSGPSLRSGPDFIGDKRNPRKNEKIRGVEGNQCIEKP